MESSPEPLDRALGQRIKALRVDARLTLEQFAGKTGISRAMLSKVERGEASPTAQLLNRLCAGLGVTLSALFAAAEAAPAPVRRRAEQVPWRDPESGYVRRVVSPAGTGSGTEIVAVDFPAGASVAFAPHLSSVDQHVWMLAGGMEVSVGDETHALAEGDCLFMQIDRPVAFRNPHDRPARYAVILSRSFGR